MGNLYLVRHGQTTCNADGIIQGPRVDSELSPIGLEQANALGEAFADLELDALYSSPLGRARQTAAAIAHHHGEDATRIAPEMYEMDYGSFCGQKIDDVRDDIAHIIDAWGMGFVNEAFPQGESPVITQHRVRRFADRIKDQAAEQDVAVVAHGRVNRILVATLLGAELSELEQFPQANANITHLEVVDGKAVVRTINGTDHLDDSAESFS